MLYCFIVSFILGIVFEFLFAGGWSAGIFILILFFVLSLIIWKDDEKFSKIFLIVGVAFCFGILRMAFVNNSPDPNLSKFVGQKISFDAVISEELDVRDVSTRYIVSVNQNSLKPQPQKCLASATGASTRKNSAEFYPCISGAAAEENRVSYVLLIADRFPELKYGDKIRVSGKLDLPKNFTSDNGTEFDYVSYLSKDKINFLIYHPQIEKTGSGGNKIISFLYSIKNIFIEKIENVVPEPSASFLGGVIFGAKQSLGQELLDDFKKVGLIHIVVLSGYNITIIAAGVFYALSFFGKRNLSFIVSVISIILFSAMVGLGATVIRACVMAIIAILARFLGRPADALRWLFVAALLMLLWNPLLLFYDPSFQLSFMATLGLILFSPSISLFISKTKWLSFIPEKFGIREIISSTLAVQFFVLPILIRMSGFASLISFVVNPIILPFVPYVMGFGALTGGLGIIPFVGKILSWPFGAISYFISQAIISTTEFSSKIPLASLQIGALPLSAIFIWYAAYAVLFMKLRKNFVQ